MIAWATSALAGPWSPPEPYLVPNLNLSIVWVDGDTSARAAVGALGGVRTRNGPWLWDTRASVLGQYGLDTGSLGADGRVGSYIGPQLRFLTWQVGPEVWANGYGRTDSPDGYLPWSPGIAIHDVLLLEAGDFVAVQLEATPGWAFVADRRTGGVGPFDELDLAAILDVHTPAFALRIGYARSYRSFGRSDALILSGAL